MVRVFLNSRRQTQLEAAENLNKQLNVQGAAVEKLYSSMTMLEQKISEAKRQKEVTSQGSHYKQWWCRTFLLLTVRNSFHQTLIARARTAKTSVQVSDMLNNLSGSSSMEAFERMKEKVDSLETQAEVSDNDIATLLLSLLFWNSNVFTYSMHRTRSPASSLLQVWARVWIWRRNFVNWKAILRLKTSWTEWSGNYLRG